MDSVDFENPPQKMTVALESREFQYCPARFSICGAVKICRDVREMGLCGRGSGDLRGNPGECRFRRPLVGDGCQFAGSR